MIGGSELAMRGSSFVRRCNRLGQTCDAVTAKALAHTVSLHTTPWHDGKGKVANRMFDRQTRAKSPYARPAGLCSSLRGASHCAPQIAEAWQFLELGALGLSTFRKGFINSTATAGVHRQDIGSR
jgi:hypothetical protein